MLITLAIANYRSLRDLILPLGRLTVISGGNGTGKSSLYRALRLIAEAAHGRLVGSLAQEGGLSSTLWAGPENLTRAMRNGEAPIQGTVRQKAVALQLGFASHDFGYAIDLGLPENANTAFSLDPVIKRECIWAGEYFRDASLLLERRGAVLRVREAHSWQLLTQHLPTYDSLFTQGCDPVRTPEALDLRERMRGWRFYDQLRTDAQAPARQARIGTHTPILAHDGADLAAALQTIREIGDATMLAQTIDDAFPGSQLEIESSAGRMSVALRQPGLLRALGASELSDGTLRYLLLAAALLSPRPPELLVLNEPETSLHPDLLAALARLILAASQRSQIIVVSHANRLIHALERADEVISHQLDKEWGQTLIAGQGKLERPAWHWPGR